MLRRRFDLSTPARAIRSSCADKPSSTVRKSAERSATTRRWRTPRPRLKSYTFSLDRNPAVSRVASTTRTYNARGSVRGQRGNL